MIVSKPFSLQYQKLLSVIKECVFELTKKTNSSGELENYDSDGYGYIKNSPIPIVSAEHGYDIHYDVTQVQNYGQGEIRYIEDGYDLVPNHTNLKLITVKFSLQSDIHHEDLTAVGLLGNLQSRLRWVKFQSELWKISASVLKTYPISTALVQYNSRLVNVAMFDVQFVLAVNDLDISERDWVNEVRIDGYYVGINNEISHDNFVFNRNSKLG